MSNLEHNLQVACVRWFGYQYPDRLIFAIPNGGHRHISVAVKLKKEGVLAGVPDLFIPEPVGQHSGLFIEMKIKPNVPTQAQIQIAKELTERGYRCEICYTFKDFENAVNDYFNTTYDFDDMNKEMKIHTNYGNFDKVVNACAFVWGIDADEIVQTKKRTRKQNVVEARHTAIFILAKQKGSLFYKKIITFFNLTERTNVYNTLRCVSDWHETDNVFKSRYNEVLEILNKENR